MDTVPYGLFALMRRQRLIRLALLMAACTACWPAGSCGGQLHDSGQHINSHTFSATDETASLISDGAGVHGDEDGSPQVAVGTKQQHALLMLDHIVIEPAELNLRIAQRVYVTGMRDRCLCMILRGVSCQAGLPGKFISTNTRLFLHCVQCRCRASWVLPIL